MSGVWWRTRSGVVPGVKRDLITVLLELMRGRTGKWDVIKYAIGSTGRTVRLVAVILAMALSTSAVAAGLYLLAVR
jgi:hypothetical protein